MGSLVEAEASIVEMRAVTKSFTATTALAAVDLDLRRGELHALLGENGAGKSTLIKVLAGIHDADSGEIRFAGRLVHPGVEKLPISFIHQDLGLVEMMTVAENVALVAGYPRTRGAIDWGRLRRETARLLLTMGGAIDPDALVVTLPAAERSIVAITRSLALKADVVVLDEPTAALGERDVSRLFDVLRTLKQSGVAILYVTHRIDEVFAIGDRVTVLRDGKRVAVTAVADTNPSELVLWIVGRRLSELFHRAQPPSATPLLGVRDLRVEHAGPLSFDVAKGEVLGLVGLRGAGHHDVGRAIFGAAPVKAGTIEIQGRSLKGGRIADALGKRVGFVSSKRADESIADGMTVRENIFANLQLVGASPVRPLARQKERRRAADVLARFDVRPVRSEEVINTLSGGNQQKVILARWLEAGSDLLVLEEPTAGIDVGAKVEIYRMLADAVEKGGGVLLISSDFEEVVRTCHRALVMSRGRVIAEVPQDELSIEWLTALAGGGATEEEEDI